MGLVQSLAFLDPAKALAAGGLLMFLASLLFWPRGGLVGYWQRGRQLVAQVRLEDALKHIYTTELSGHLASLLSIAGALQVTLDRAAEV